jgi:hypothetical protein
MTELVGRLLKCQSGLREERCGCVAQIVDRRHGNDFRPASGWLEDDLSEVGLQHGSSAPVSEHEGVRIEWRAVFGQVFAEQISEGRRDVDSPNASTCLRRLTQELPPTDLRRVLDHADRPGLEVNGTNPERGRFTDP